MLLFSILCFLVLLVQYLGFCKERKRKINMGVFHFYFKTVINFEHASKQCSTKKITLKTGWNGLVPFKYDLGFKFCRCNKISWNERLQ